MTAFESSYPAGVRPLDGARALLRRRTEQSVAEIIESCGFSEVILPMIDFLAPYEGIADGVLLRQSYRFVDRDGELVWVRSDFTPLLARMLAPGLCHDQLPLRAFYRGEVIRCQQARLGGTSGFYQIGAEMIGRGGIADDVEILRTLGSIFSALAIPVVVSITDVRIVEALLSAYSETDGERVRSALARKSIRELDAEADGLQALARGELTIERLLDLPATREIGERLDATIRSLPPIGGVRWVAALDDVDALNSYYTGLRFRIDSADGRATLGRGGRYDALYGRFGFDAPAIGFTLDLDVVEERR